MADRDTHPILSEPHARGITSTLRIVEQTVFLIEQLLAGDQVGLTVATRTPLDAPQRERLHALIQETRAQIAAFVPIVPLSRYERDGRRVITGHLTEAWADLEDIRPAKLGRYGPLDPALATRLGPPVARLIDLVEAIRKEVAA